MSDEDTRPRRWLPRLGALCALCALCAVCGLAGFAAGVVVERYDREGGRL
jgi:hypothetical protein